MRTPISNSVVWSRETRCKDFGFQSQNDGTGCGRLAFCVAKRTMECRLRNAHNGTSAKNERWKAIQYRMKDDGEEEHECRLKNAHNGTSAKNERWKAIQCQMKECKKRERTWAQTATLRNQFRIAR